MSPEQRMVNDFHAKYGCVSCMGDTPDMISLELRLLRARLIAEESAEFLTACSNADMEGMVDALVDLLYVTYGAAIVMGVDIEPIFAEVQRSNMTKDGGGLDTGGKVCKGPNFSPPDISHQLELQGYRCAS